MSVIAAAQSTPLTDAITAHRPIGELLLELGHLTEHDIRRVLIHQHKKGLRFGEAARSLRLVSEDDLQRALARQLNYTYIPRGESGLDPQLVSAYEPFGAPAEAIRILRSQLALRWFDDDRKTLAIGGARGAAGVSALAANLAISFAQSGERTLVLDANFRQPAQQALFGVTAQSGLADILMGRCSLENAVVTLAQPAGLYVLCAGTAPRHPQELLSGRGLRYVFDLTQEWFDIVIVDMPPVLEFAEAPMIAAQTGGYLLAARRHESRLGDMQAAMARFAPSNATLLGAVIND